MSIRIEVYSDMKPSEVCKQHGLTLKEVSEIAETSQANLINWHRDRPELFRAVVFGCKNLSTSGVKEVLAEIDALKMTVMFFEDQILEAKDKVLAVKAENALLKQQLKRKGEH